MSFLLMLSLLVMMSMIQLGLVCLGELLFAVVKDPELPTIYIQIVILTGGFFDMICIPMIQCYFRKELWAAICCKVSMLKQVFTCYCYKGNAATNT